jgi:hypothetical protein
VLAAAALAGCTTASFNWTGQGPVSNPADSPGSTAGPVVSATPAGRLPPESVPPYFLELAGPAGTAAPAGPPQPLDVTIRASFTGRAMAVVRPPGNPGTFTFVTASTSDGRAFLVGAQPWDPDRFGTDDSAAPVSFYLLRFDPASRRAQLTPLPVPAASLAGGAFISAALSPDGTRLAVAGAGHVNVLDVHVYPVPAGGRGQAWTVTGRITSDIAGARLSWSANDRVLAVGLAFGTVRLLDTAVPPGRAAAIEDITLGVKDGYQCYDPVLMTSDGSSLVCGVAADYFYRETVGSTPRRGGFAVYGIRTGDLTAVLGAEGTGQPANGRTPTLIWASPRGTILIGQPLLGKVSLFSNGHYQPIAWTGVQEAVQPVSPIAPGLPGGVLRPLHAGINEHSPEQVWAISRTREWAVPAANRSASSGQAGRIRQRQLSFCQAALGLLPGSKPAARWAARAAASKAPTRLTME